MEYTLHVDKIDQASDILRVRYDAESKTSVFKQFVTSDFSSENIKRLSDTFLPQVLRIWNAEGESHELEGASFPLTVKPKVKDPMPEFDPATEKLSEEVIETDSEIRTSYTVVPLTDEELSLRLDELREVQRSRLKVKRDMVVSSPISGIQVSTVVDRENITGVVNNWETVLGNPESVPWVTADNTVALVTKNELLEVTEAYVRRKSFAYGIYTQLLEQLSISQDPTAVTWPTESELLGENV